MKYTWATPGKLIGSKEVLKRVGVSRVTLAKKIEAGTFPAPLDQPGHRRWRETDLEEWMTTSKRAA